MEKQKLIEQLDEPQKVKVPAFVAPFIDKLKTTNRRYGFELERTYESSEDNDLRNWIGFNENVLTVFKALENGYDVEEEPKYFVELKTLGRSYFLIQNLTMFGEIHTQLNEARENPYAKKWKSTFTEKEIKSIDERYWAFAVPVEEVVEG